jgi:uncharacterized protein involved in response to NO
LDAARRPHLLEAYRVFYPVAALYAALTLPFTVALRPALHAHEMLVGFALAVVAGNQLGPASGAQVASLLGLWIAARVASFVDPGGWVDAIANGAFAALVGLNVAPRLFGAAKKWRNLALPLVLTGLCIAAAFWPVGREAMIVLFCALLLFMGGRILAASVAGQLYRQGQPLDARVQPRLEGALLIACALALFFPAPALLAAGVLAAVRMARWRLWQLRGRPDLLCLAAGYGWLALGLALFGIASAAGEFERIALHVITIGALGTMTFNVMASSWLLKARRAPPQHIPALVCGTGLIAAAALLRAIGEFEPPWLLVAAACWTGAFSILLGVFLANLKVAAQP